MPPGTFLGTIDRTPPPFFRQGPSALTKVVVCAAVALFLMVADARFSFVVPLRAGLATVLLPIQRALMLPVQLVAGGSTYLSGLEEARRAEQVARTKATELAELARRGAALERDNAQLRQLLGLAPTLPARGQAADVMYEARDAYSRKIVLDRGAAQGIRAGSPVLVADGVLGQVTRVYPLSAEVTLLTDKDAAIPVLNQRTQQRLAAFGGAGSAAEPMLELRFVSSNSDLQAGDQLLTNGLDGVYPPGLPVAHVVSVERPVSGGFARVLLAPAAAGDGVRQVLVLDPVTLPAAAPATPARQAASSSVPASAGATAAAGPASAPRDAPAAAASPGSGAASAPAPRSVKRSPVAPRKPPPPASTPGARRP
ncbi:MAG: rod shape-determining protein MreC [Rubrivivax sp.]